MKKITVILLLIGHFLYAQNYTYLGNYTSDGTPTYLVNPRDVVSTATLELISNSLPEQYPVPIYNPQYITAGFDTDIKLQQEADVWVTFVDEGAGYKNTLGFYTYDLNNPPTLKPSGSDIKIIFPNVSKLGSGGSLKTGDKVKIGTFPAGTGIGWVLIANAWSSSANKVGFGHWTLYSNPDFNPEASSSLRNHNVLLKDAINQRIILGFEDIRRDYGSCDNDFNDAIFYITASPYSAIISENMVDVTSSSNVTSAYDGGLESNGNLATLIAKRNLERLINNDQLNKIAHQKSFKKENYYRKSTTLSLLEFLPETGMYGTEIAKVSSPEDLKGITNADEVFAVDYYQDNMRLVAVLATSTKEKIYDHTKIICDRLNNSSLEDVRTVITRGHKLISSKIKRATGEIEYTLSFSIKMDSTTNQLFSFWNIEQYPTGNFQNYQVWGSSYSQVFAIANAIIDKHTALYGLTSIHQDDITPLIFVKSGYYENGKLKLEIVNKQNENSLLFDGNLSKTENATYENIFSEITLNSSYTQNIEIQTGVLFDIGFSIGSKLSQQKDILYMADGPWGLDYLTDLAIISNFEITANDDNYVDFAHELNRNPKVSGKVKGNVNLFRHVLPGNQTLDLKNYNYFNFEITNNLPLEIVIIQDENRNWEDRIRKIIPANTASKAISLDLTSFVDGSGKKVNIANVKTIVFSVIGDYVNFSDFDIDIKNVSFSTNQSLSVTTFNTIETKELKNYPNPFSTQTTIELPNFADEVTLKVFDIMGRKVDERKLNVQGTKVIYSPKKMNRGIYKYILQDNTKKQYKGSFFIN